MYCNDGLYAQYICLREHSSKHARGDRVSCIHYTRQWSTECKLPYENLLLTLALDSFVPTDQNKNCSFGLASVMFPAQLNFPSLYML